ncbi:hypothetical protein OBBRIDRAFT_791398 [Obba rivulosa]|uniref:Hemerythrin-like domain-containing protein n=1 Tax=Obba rivulosa TaxID=1052685 RepID=A0A8E2B4H3_9APHY|nr:hypothetical protein OBBRIDRAFT_791398 [Obba rivulosa]
MAQEDARWNRMAEHMRGFHDHFKWEFNFIYQISDGSFSSRGMSLRIFLSRVQQLIRSLTVHHTIEEQYIFPVLAKRMPAFGSDEAHLKSHEGIHHGLDDLTKLVQKWTVEPSTYNPQEMRECLDSWREVLFKHLDEEVEDLSGENMKKYWKLEEVDKLPI